MRSQVKTLDRAVTLLGINATLSLALSFSLVRGLRRSKTARFDHQAFWRRSINDTYDHPGGDAVLISVARVLQSATRNFDTVVRYGGDEFVVLLLNTSEQVAYMVSERICAAVAGRPHQVGDDRTIQVTVSVGCVRMSSRNRFASATDLLEAADRCLYAAKSGGRNRVVTMESLNQVQG